MPGAQRDAQADRCFSEEGTEGRCRRLQGRGGSDRADATIGRVRLNRFSKRYAVTNASGQPPCSSMTSSISAMRRIVSLIATTIFW